MFLVIEIDVCRCPHLFRQTNCQTRTLQGEQVLHAGRALPPLQKTTNNYRGWVSDSSFLPALSPSVWSCLTLTGHLQPCSAASTCTASHSSAGACSLLLLPRGHQGIWDAFVTQPSTTGRLELWRSRGPSRLHSLCSQKGREMAQAVLLRVGHRAQHSPARSSCWGQHSTGGGDGGLWMSSASSIASPS